MRTYIAVTLLALFAAPLVSYAQTSVPATCVSFWRNLGYGSRGDDVTELQRYFIAQNLLPSGDDSGFFGKDTERAAQGYQASHGIVSSGTATSTGFGVIGPRTRASFGHCAANQPAATSPTTNANPDDSSWLLHALTNLQGPPSSSSSIEEARDALITKLQAYGAQQHAGRLPTRDTSPSQTPTVPSATNPASTASAQTSTPTSAVADASGQPMPVGDLPGWHQVFTDDFTTDVALGNFPGAVSNKWSAYLDGWSDHDSGTYMPSKVVSIHDGVMDVYLHTENGIHMVDASVPKIPGATGSEGGLLYGRYTIRFKADSLAGYHPAWLLWPDSETWPRDGEIDFPEGDLNSSICAFMHRQDGTSAGDQDAFCSNTPFTGWHTATTEWLPTGITFILDGTIVGHSTSRIPDTPMHWVIQSQSAITTVPSDATAGHILIDWVAAYTPD